MAARGYRGDTLTVQVRDGERIVRCRNCLCEVEPRNIFLHRCDPEKVKAQQASNWLPNGPVKDE